MTSDIEKKYFTVILRKLRRSKSAGRSFCQWKAITKFNATKSKFLCALRGFLEYIDRDTAVMATRFTNFRVINMGHVIHVWAMVYGPHEFH